MSKRDRYLIRARNKAIRQTFYHYVATGVPVMTAYTMTAEDFYISERSVRDIIAKKNKNNLLATIANKNT